MPIPQPTSPTWATTPLRYTLLSLYWLPVSLFWGMMLGQVLPVRVEDFSGPLHKGAYLGVIAGVGAAVSAATQLVAGPLSDACRSRWGRRRPFVLVGTLVAAAAMAAFGWSASFPALAASYFVVQCFLNVANGPYCAYLPDLTPPSRLGAASAVTGVMNLLGKAGGPLAAGLVVQAALRPYARMAQTPAVLHAASVARLGAFRELLLADAALFVACALVTVLALPDPPMSASAPAVKPRSALRDATRWDVRDHPDFFRLMTARGVYNLGFYIALAYLPYYVQDSLGLGLRYAGPLQMLQVFTIGGALLGTLPAGLTADRVSKRAVIYAACAFSAVAAAAFALAGSVGVAYAMAVAFGVGYGAFCAVDWAFACNLLPAGGPAKYLAIWGLSDTLPQIAAQGFGPAADALNRARGAGAGWRAAMLAAAVSILAGAVSVRRVRERRPTGRAGEERAAAVAHGNLP